MLNSDWLSDSIMNGDWLYFSHVKNAIHKPDWTYRFFTGENIAHIEFYLQGLLPKILAIHTIKRRNCHLSTDRSFARMWIVEVYISVMKHR